MTAVPNAVWTLRNATAWVFLAGEHLTKPVILVGDSGTDLATLTEAADHDAYALRSELHARGHDLILLALSEGGSMTGDGGAVQNTVLRATAERYGSAPLVVGGTGHGALAARYGLATMEYQRIDHQTSVHFSHDGAAPALEDEAELDRTGGRPQRPLFLRMVDSGVDDGLGKDDEIADDVITGEADGSGALLSEEYGSWLLERLPS
ncbi:hypothetical protein [Streptomyces sp. NPDC004284]|uniref:hypothetical protein n=1 Tax=Streptomyces sp. NPDC004284 TaxID=3364695 RepID=UPI00369BC3DC